MTREAAAKLLTSRGADAMAAVRALCDELELKSPTISGRCRSIARFSSPCNVRSPNAVRLSTPADDRTVSRARRSATSWSW